MMQARYFHPAQGEACDIYGLLADDLAQSGDGDCADLCPQA